jgi:predicted DNA-binding transcriptional regulator AlpA
MNAVESLPEPPALLDVKALAAMMDCSERHIWRMHDSGKLPTALRIGALRRWPASVIREWIANGCRPVRRTGNHE